MKNFLDKLLISGVLGASILVSGVFAADINITIDGKNLEFTDARPFISNEGRTLVPLRSLAEGLNAKVGWDEEEQKVTVEKNFVIPFEYEKDKYQTGKSSVEFRINSQILNFEFYGINTTNQRKDAVEELKMDTHPMIFEGRTYLPARFVANLCGYQVDWDQANNTVICKNINKVNISEFSGTFFNPEDDVAEKKKISKLEELKVGDLVFMDTANSLKGKTLYYSEYQDENPNTSNVIDIRNMSEQEQSIIHTKSAGIAFEVIEIETSNNTIKIKANIDIDVSDIANNVEDGNISYKNKLIELDGTYLDKLISIDLSNMLLEFTK